MLGSLKSLTRRVLQVVLACVPWLGSMYVLYWLEYDEIWTTATAHRGKISVAILTAGMGMSFLLYSFFIRRARKGSEPRSV